MIITAVHTVYKRILYVVLSVAVALPTALFALLWPNAALLQVVWSSTATNLTFKIQFTTSLLEGSASSVGWLSVIVVVLTSFLLGVIVSMSVYVWRHKRTSGGRRVLASTSSGTMAAVLGIGCVACGPLLLGGLLATLGAGGLLMMLPLHGAEFGFLALGLLSYALYALARIITAPPVCAIE